MILSKQLVNSLNSLVMLFIPNWILDRVDERKTDKVIRGINTDRKEELAKVRSAAQLTRLVANITHSEKLKRRSLCFQSEPIEPFIRRAVVAPNKSNREIAIVTRKTPSIAPAGRTCALCGEVLRGRATKFCQEKYGIKRWCSNQWHPRN